ncbi:TPA: hypothetical protein ACG0TZ_003289 [Acinetobacter baumannii]
MTDLNKEREAFEQHLIDIGLVEFAGYGFDVNECDEYTHEPTNVAWGAWVIGLNRAKAQAVPVWISADFMKPDEGNLVLGISTTKLAKFNVYQVVALDEFDECEINYWMPLPTAPSESGAEQ